LLLQPLLAPSLTGEAETPFAERYCTKANAWIAIFSYLANYWGTHYIYCVFGGKYTMPFLPAHQLNGVPVAMYFALHTCFCFYHALANKVLRRVENAYQSDMWSSLFAVVLVFVIAYILAIIETSMAASYFYTVEDWGHMYSFGSAFYALFLMISFPMFMRLGSDACRHTLKEACLEALATFMIIMCLVDAVRLVLGIEFRMPA